MNDILLASEVEFYIESLSPHPFMTIGSRHWLEHHQKLQKLNQQALIEASSNREEHVKEVLVTFGKLSVLIHEAIGINIWKYKVLPKLLQLNEEPKHTIIAYTILYHEAVAVMLLELSLYHCNVCESLNDSAADLLDYASSCASQLIAIKYQETSTKNCLMGSQELYHQRNNISFEIGMRSLTIIRYLADYVHYLTLDISSRMYNTLDIPVLMVEILLRKPWLDDQKQKQFVSGKWVEWDGEMLCNAEAQAWLALHQLLLNQNAMTYYSITDARRSQLMKLLMLLSPIIIDQIAPLVDLRTWLSRISVGDIPPSKATPILMETILEIKQSILSETKEKWKSIAEQQLGDVFCYNECTLLETGQLLADAFNMDLMEQIESKTYKKKCENCEKIANKRCSQCKQAWYCSKSCQAAHWPIHNCIS